MPQQCRKGQYQSFRIDCLVPLVGQMIFQDPQLTARYQQCGNRNADQNNRRSRQNLLPDACDPPGYPEKQPRQSQTSKQYICIHAAGLPECANRNIQSGIPQQMHIRTGIGCMDIPLVSFNGFIGPPSSSYIFRKRLLVCFFALRIRSMGNSSVI